jgi:hypothetical protein
MTKKGIWQNGSADAGRSFVELWRRIEEGQFPYTKAELCRLIGCSLRWAEEFVARTGRQSP